MREKQLHKPYEGLFITIEGGDGAGKSTFAGNLAVALEEKGYCVYRTREPGGTALSEEIRKIILNPNSPFKIGERAELLLFLAARAQHIEETILPALREKKVVICERFNDSTVAYQGAARHLGMGHVEALCSLATNLEPDKSFFLDIDPEEGLRRAKEKRNQPLDRLELEQLQFHRDVRQAFLHLADCHCDRISVIDATESPEEMVDKALKALEPNLTLKPC